MVRFAAVLLMLATLALAACGGGAQSGSGGATGGGGSGGDVTRGRTVFETKGCPACHTLNSVPSATGTTGPTLNSIGTVAGSRKPGMNAEAYIRESEQNPNAFIVQGFTQGVMPAWSGTAAELNDLVAFLLAQR